MVLTTLQARLTPELVDWFRVDNDGGDAPELHLVGLTPRDVVRCCAAIQELGPRWNARTFHVDDEGIDVTALERPDFGELVASGRVTQACVGAEGITVDGTELPLVEMFIFVDAIEFFWWPHAGWSPERVTGFFALLMRLLALAPKATLRPDPRYAVETRHAFSDSIARVIDDPSRLDLGERV
jgi:hypothetical protein